MGVSLNNTDLLEVAVTHRSYLGETSGLTSNERLEFLGDSVLGLVVCRELYRRMPDSPEGDLSKAKSVAVSEPVLAEAAKSLELSRVMRLSTGERQSGGHLRPSILSDMYEALIAVIYLDQGLEPAAEFIVRTLAPILEDIEAGTHLRDYKSQLQALAQGSYKTTPRYIVTDETGADHDKTFTIRVEIGGVALGAGSGKSKKQAEQRAAEEALGNLDSAPVPKENE